MGGNVKVKVVAIDKVSPHAPISEAFCQWPVYEMKVFSSFPHFIEEETMNK